MNKDLLIEQTNNLLETLKNRFDKNMNRHPNIKWSDVESMLDNKKLLSLNEMEKTGGEPDVVIYNNELYFFDCSIESPSGRRGFCYDNEALENRKENKPKGSTQGMAHDIDIEILTKEQYEHLQTLGNFDLKTSSWIKTPEDVRKLGGALFCDYRYEKVFTYHNGAESYYGSRGFRGSLKI